MAAGWQYYFGTLPDGPEIVRAGLRLLTALLIGGCIGLQRELTHHSAGFRTHILVAMGSALLVLAGSQSGLSASDLSRIIQGIVTGIGFLGAGAILKLTGERQILGLTTAAGIWMTATASIAAALGRIVTAVIALILTLIVLGVLIKFEQRFRKRYRDEARPSDAKRVGADSNQR